MGYSAEGTSAASAFRLAFLGRIPNGDVRQTVVAQVVSPATKL